MSLIIKGIDLPKEGYASNIDIVYNGDVWISKNGEWELHEKSAIQIEKPHGRIIDEDEIYEQPHCGECNDATIDAINNAPTILEEEE